MKSSTRKSVLTDRALRALKPAAPGKRYVAWDTTVPNFGVRVTDRGAKSFIVVRRRTGERDPITVVVSRYNHDAAPGTQGTLAHARQEAREALGAITQGIHPHEVEDRRRQDEARRRRDTFGVVAEEFIRRHVVRLRSARAYEALTRRELLAAWGDKPITAITRRDAIDLVEAISDRAGRHQARKAFAIAAKLFNWALARDTYGLEASPFARIKTGDLLGQFEARSRVLSDDELRLVWAAAGRMGYPFGDVIRMLCLTAQRRGEVSAMRWSEIEGDVLTVPAARMKGKVAHTVPLTPEARRLIEAAPRFGGDAYVFTTTGGKLPVSGFSKIKNRLDAEVLALNGAPLAAWTLHDIRRTVRTRLSGLGVLPLVAELVIAHRQGGIHAVYDLHTYDAEKRDALARWEAALLAIVEPKRPQASAAKKLPRNVVRLDARRPA